jgi:hypothetical protein
MYVCMYVCMYYECIMYVLCMQYECMHVCDCVSGGILTFACVQFGIIGGIHALA